MAELARLHEDEQRLRNWKRWGTYLSERQWGTVREDYSPHGNAWRYLPHDHARSRAYRWGEDGLAGFCDRHQYVCFAIALWNERDAILKERLFGLDNEDGNHGEDAKEIYFYLDATPTHSYARMLYKYPQRAFPYAQLVEESRRRGRELPEYEITDTGVFDDGRYFDVEVEYAKRTPEDVLVRITVSNRGPDAAPLHLLPTIWFRNTWSWGLDPRRPVIRAHPCVGAAAALEVDHEYYDRRWLAVDTLGEVLFTENESNTRRLWGVESGSPHVKDAFHDYVVHGVREAVSPLKRGTKAAFHHVLRLAPGESRTVKLRLSDQVHTVDDPDALGAEHDDVFARRRAEAAEFHAALEPQAMSREVRTVMRQAIAGLLWSKQFYHYEVDRWLAGDPEGPPPPESRRGGRNGDWTHLYNADVVSMPDKWEYPWYAAWDLAFHCIPLALVDPDFAKQQLILLLREWYMHPNGQLPAYEWNFGDVNPPVHAWAAWRVYKIEAKRRGGVGDRTFLERVFHKLLLNFTWWVNRKDAQGRNVFQGGFLGLDNIGVFDRSKPLPTGGVIEQSDATSWMGMYCLNMLAIALELAREDRAYEDVASKFFEHFVYICHAMNNLGGHGVELWDCDDGFFYDVLALPDGRKLPLKVRSLVGLIPLYGVETLDSELIDRLPAFKRRMQWFIENRPEFGDHVETSTMPDLRVLRLLALVGRDRLRQVLRYMLDEDEFLSPYGVRALSRHHLQHPYQLEVDGTVHRVDYEPGESRSGLFGGNSNWRGPVWLPVNFLLIEALQRYHFFYGDDLKVECPTGSGVRMNLWQVAAELSRRLVRLFLPDEHGVRPSLREVPLFRKDPHFTDLVLFHEYFHGETGAGLGASHQTGWTALVAKLIQQSGG
ncbi:MAG: glucosidase [Thermodesulfobacteriota bacterium]